MSPRKDRRAASESWLLDDAVKPKARGRKPGASGGPDSEARQWLKVPSPSNKRTTVKNPSSNGGGGARKEEPRSRRSSVTGRLTSQREHRLAAKLGRAERKLQSQQEELARMRERVAELEAELSRGSRKRKRADSSSAAPPAARKRAKHSPTRASSGTNSRRRLSLNDASFEQLRGIGLSVTQSTRLVAYRDTHGSFKSVDDLRGIPGFPKETLIDLKKRLRV